MLRQIDDLLVSLFKGVLYTAFFIFMAVMSFLPALGQMLVGGYLIIDFCAERANPNKPYTNYPGLYGVFVIVVLLVQSIVQYVFRLEIGKALIAGGF